MNEQVGALNSEDDSNEQQKKFEKAKSQLDFDAGIYVQKKNHSKYATGSGNKSSETLNFAPSQDATENATLPVEIDPESMKFPEDYLIKFNDLIEAQKIMPSLALVLDQQIGNLIENADRAGMNLQEQLSLDLGSFGGQEKLDRAVKAKRESTKFFALVAEEDREEILNYMAAPKPGKKSTPQVFDKYPELKNAFAETQAIIKDADYLRAKQIQADTYTKLVVLAILREEYAKHLSESGKIADAKLLLAQAKELRQHMDVK